MKRTAFQSQRLARQATLVIPLAYLRPQTWKFLPILVPSAAQLALHMTSCRFGESHNVFSHTCQHRGTEPTQAYCISQDSGLWTNIFIEELQPQACTNTSELHLPYVLVCLCPL